MAWTAKKSRISAKAICIAMVTIPLITSMAAFIAGGVIHILAALEARRCRHDPHNQAPAHIQAMRILIACEFSGTVRDAFIARGHDAMSCDLLPTESPGPHYQGDVQNVIGRGWDLMIAHPPCTHLSVSGARYFAAKRKDGRQQAAIDFFMMLANASIPMIVIENPVCIMSTHYRKPDQIIQPWQFGHGETKATCLWLKGIPKLTPTNIVSGRADRVHKLPPSPDRWKLRSATYQGIADAMAAQWGESLQVAA
jgi:hypothetical protein